MAMDTPWTMKNTAAFVFLLVALSLSTVDGRRQESGAWISSLENSAPELQVLRDQIRTNLRSSYREQRLALPLRIYLYRLKENENFFTVVTRTGQDPDTIASLNGLANPASVGPGDVLLIPNARGVFRRNRSLEEVAALKENLQKRPASSASTDQLLEGFRFYPGRRFEPEERFYFRGQGFAHPLPGAVLSSGYGNRRDPINNRKSFHGGIDLAAKVGTPVLASAPGKVIHAGPAGGYGNLIILEHRYEYTTYYGHLSKIHVKKGDSVNQGQKIGEVGKTGRVTGPHLHFEIRKDGKHTSPSKFFHP